VNNGADEPWLYFVTDCWQSQGHGYDLVLGPVANDKVFTTVNLFEDAPAYIPVKPSA